MSICFPSIRNILIYLVSLLQCIYVSSQLYLLSSLFFISFNYLQFKISFPQNFLFFFFFSFLSSYLFIFLHLTCRTVVIVEIIFDPCITKITKNKFDQDYRLWFSLTSLPEEWRERKERERERETKGTLDKLFDFTLCSGIYLESQMKAASSNNSWQTRQWRKKKAYFTYISLSLISKINPECINSPTL